VLVVYFAASTFIRPLKVIFVLFVINSNHHIDDSGDDISSCYADFNLCSLLNTFFKEPSICGLHYRFSTVGLSVRLSSCAYTHKTENEQEAKLSLG